MDYRDSYAYVFVPFNLPFDRTVAQVQPEIDLQNGVRATFKEIATFLQ